MPRGSLGEFEQLVLFAILHLAAAGCFEAHVCAM